MVDSEEGTIRRGREKAEEKNDLRKIREDNLAQASLSTPHNPPPQGWLRLATALVMSLWAQCTRVHVHFSAPVSDADGRLQALQEVKLRGKLAARVRGVVKRLLFDVAIARREAAIWRPASSI
eukprot:93494-Pleurochrysis_carterae.AAC.1